MILRSWRELVLRVRRGAAQRAGVGRRLALQPRGGAVAGRCLEATVSTVECGHGRHRFRPRGRRANREHRTRSIFKFKKKCAVGTAACCDKNMARSTGTSNRRHRNRAAATQSRKLMMRWQGTVRSWSRPHACVDATPGAEASRSRPDLIRGGSSLLSLSPNTGVRHSHTRVRLGLRAGPPWPFAPASGSALTAR